MILVIDNYDSFTFNLVQLIGQLGGDPVVRRNDEISLDEIAVLLRAPQQYLGLLEHACRRAGLPVWFDRGVKRPHPVPAW